MDHIHIENLSFSGKHGVYEHERRVEQEFLVSLKLDVDTKKAGKSDKLKDTVDYADIKEIIQKAVKGKSHCLIEKLAESMALEILKDSRIRHIEISIRKTAVWDNGVPGVTLRRKNKKHPKRN